jgi:alkanesulfonate monooxygenase SsuD/methylene tetrahydromethanopterin reductase-like flavin-dependent oxidoreductase (luciferase family)
MMTGLIFGRDQKELQEKLNDRKAEDLRKNGIVFGTPEDVIKQIKELEKAGVQRVMLQWLELDDLERLEAFARLVLPHFASN